MSADRHFFDTNVLVYAFDRTAPAKAKTSDELVYAALASGRGMISYQVAQEFIAVVRKPFRTAMTFVEIEKYWDKTLRPLLQVHSSPALFLLGIDICRLNQISWYDALIVAAALQGQCKVLYSEDLQHGQRFGDLVVKNPFL
jgi:predicted nucleic acid-binding protein